MTRRSKKAEGAGRVAAAGGPCHTGGRGAPGSAAGSLAGVGLADDLDYLVGLVRHADQAELRVADVSLGQHGVLEPAEQAGPVRPADEHDGALGDLAGSDQGQRLEPLVARA